MLSKLSYKTFCFVLNNDIVDSNLVCDTNIRIKAFLLIGLLLIWPWHSWGEFSSFHKRLIHLKVLSIVEGGFGGFSNGMTYIKV